MRLADLEKLVKEIINTVNLVFDGLNELQKRIEVLERAHETNNDPGSGDPNSGSEPSEDSINPSEPK